MSKWPMRGHFGHLHFNTFPMTPRTPQGEVFCPFLSDSKHSGVPEDSKSPTLGVWVSSSHLAKVGLRHEMCLHNIWKLWTQSMAKCRNIVLMFYMQVYQLANTMVQVRLLCNERFLAIAFSGHTCHCLPNPSHLLWLLTRLWEFYNGFLPFPFGGCIMDFIFASASVV
jgi:hypothetical protein